VGSLTWISGCATRLLKPRMAWVGWLAELIAR
jgi:hypothetical protein